MRPTVLTALVYFFALWGLAIAPALAQRSRSLSVSNTSDRAFTDAIVEIPWRTVLASYPKLDTARFRVLSGNGQELPYQLERRGDKVVRNLLVRVSVPARQTVRLTLENKPSAPVPALTYARYVPERKDDFAWENDKIAFRIYGTALNGTSENAYGTDVWSKRTNRLILNDWYKRENYHKDNGDGLDYYKVGYTLGAGDVGAWLGDSIGFIHNYATWQVLDNGPLRSTFRVTYPAYTFGSTTVNLSKIISLDAGSQLSRVTVTATHNHTGALPMVVGISLRPEPGTVRFDTQTKVMSYWEPAHGPNGADGTLGIGCVFPDEGTVGPMREGQKHALTGFSAKSGVPFTYYSGAAWDKAGQITSPDAWSAYLNQYAAQLKNPLVVK